MIYYIWNHFILLHCDLVSFRTLGTAIPGGVFLFVSYKIILLSSYDFCVCTIFVIADLNISAVAQPFARDFSTYSIQSASSFLRKLTVYCWYVFCCTASLRLYLYALSFFLVFHWQNLLLWYNYNRMNGYYLGWRSFLSKFMVWRNAAPLYGLTVFSFILGLILFQ